MGLTQSTTLEPQSTVNSYHEPQFKRLSAILDRVDNLTIAGIPMSGHQLYRFICLMVGLAESHVYIDKLLSQLNQKLLTVSFAEFSTVYPQVSEYLIKLVQTNHLDDFDKLCEGFIDILPLASHVSGRIVQTFLKTTDDVTPVDIVIKELIETGVQSSFQLVEEFYNSLDLEVLHMLNDQELCLQFCLQVANEVSKAVSRHLTGSSSDTLTERNCTEVIIHRVIDERFKQHLSTSCRLLIQLIKVSLIILSVNKFCTEDDADTDTVGPISLLVSSSSYTTSSVPVATPEPEPEPQSETTPTSLPSTVGSADKLTHNHTQVTVTLKDSKIVSVSPAEQQDQIGVYVLDKLNQIPLDVDKYGIIISTTPTVRIIKAPKGVNLTVRSTF